MLLEEGLILYQPDENVFEFANDLLPYVSVLSMDDACHSYAMSLSFDLICRLWIVLTRDVFHTECNDVKLGLAPAGVWYVVVLTTVAFDMLHGPYLSGAFWQTNDGRFASFNGPRRLDQPHIQRLVRSHLRWQRFIAFRHIRAHAFDSRLRRGK